MILCKIILCYNNFQQNPNYTGENNMGKDILSRIETLIETPAFLIDIFPETIPQREDNRYFVIEEYFQNCRSETDQKFLNILLKLYCYYNFIINYTPEKLLENTSPDQVLAFLDSYVMEKNQITDFLNIFLPECDALLVLNRNDLYITVYNPGSRLKNLLSQLAYSEGLFFYKAPN